MTRTPLNILLIEDNPGDARLIREMLADASNGDGSFRLEWAGCLQQGRERLLQGRVDLVLLDLSLPDSHGLETCRAIREAAEDVVVIVLTGHDDMDAGTHAVQEGAQDYLVKGRVDGALLTRAIRYALERQRLLQQLRALSITDELTGLFNRRGLVMSGEQVTRLARRMGQEVYLLFMDLDGLKGINDTLGHAEGDRALRDLAAVLKFAFRDSDVVARVGGDEFVVLGAARAAEGGRAARDRLLDAVARHNEGTDVRHQLSLSTGVVTWGPGEHVSLDEMLSRADALMYAQKRARRMPEERREVAG